jgi:uncharacterized protein (DUF433 family)
VVADLGIADLLAKGTNSCGELAQATGSHPQALYRLLRALASVGIFSEVEPERFELTPMAEALRTDAPVSLRDRALQVCGDVQWRTWGQLGYSVRTGQPAFKQVHDMDAKKEMSVPDPLITTSADRLSGTPVFAGTRVPVQTLVDYLEEGDSLDDFLADFPSVSRAHAIAVLELAKSALLAKAVAA